MVGTGDAPARRAAEPVKDNHRRRALFVLQVGVQLSRAAYWIVKALRL